MSSFRYIVHRRVDETFVDPQMVFPISGIYVAYVSIFLKFGVNCFFAKAPVIKEIEKRIYTKFAG